MMHDLYKKFQIFSPHSTRATKKILTRMGVRINELAIYRRRRGLTPQLGAHPRPSHSLATRHSSQG